MAERPFYFVVVLILFFNVEIFSQGNSPECIKLPINYNIPANYPFQDNGKLNSFQDNGKLNYYTGNSIIKLRKTTPGPETMRFHLSMLILSPSFYSNHLSFFCNKEMKLEKLTSVPLRLRLGSLDYVNYLEQKPNALKPH